MANKNVAQRLIPSILNPFNLQYEDLTVWQKGFRLMINKIKSSQSDAHTLNPQSSILNPSQDLKEIKRSSTHSIQQGTKVLIIAAGTGGHIFPALAVARALKKQSVEVMWLGTYHGLEGNIVPREGIPLERIEVTGLRGKGFKKWIVAPVQLIKALFNSWKIIRKQNPDIILAMGGFVCGPSCLAAKLLRKKIIIHEQNAVPGMTNQILSHLASKILTGFPSSFSSDAQTKVIYIGNPIREEIERIPEPEKRFKDREGPIRLLIMGGSQGAASFNQVIPEAIAMLPPERRPVIYHQSGGRYLEMATAAYQSLGVDARVVPFIEDIAEAYTWADLAICRSGAITVSELCSVGLASILIPYPYHVDEQQKHNAMFLVEAGAAALLTHQELMSGRLLAIFESLSSSRQHLLDMAKAGRTLRKENVAQAIAERLF